MNIKKNMKKWLFLALILSAVCIETVSAARLQSCQNQASTANQAVVTNVVSVSESASNRDELVGDEESGNREIVASNSDLGVQIDGVADEQGSYGKLTLRTPVFQCSLSGTQVQNPTYAPQITTADLDGDGQKEFIIHLTSGYGTGVELNSVQVFRQNGDSIPVQSLNEAISNQFHSAVQGSNLTLTLNGKTSSIPLGQLAEQPDTQQNTPPVTGGAVQQYEVNGNTLSAIYSLQVGMMTYIGELHANYQYENGTLQLAPASLELEQQ